MTPLRFNLIPIPEGTQPTGMVWMTDGVPTHTIEWYIEWSKRAKVYYDNPESCWKKLFADNAPTIVFDKDENPL